MNIFPYSAYHTLTKIWFQSIKSRFSTLPRYGASMFLNSIAWFRKDVFHYNDVIMGVAATQITSLSIAFSTVHSGADQRKHQSSASLAFVRGPVNSPHRWPVTRKMFPFDDVIMLVEVSSWSAPAHVRISNVKVPMYTMRFCGMRSFILWKSFYGIFIPTHFHKWF